jgi:selenide,water dikinase
VYLLDGGVALVQTVDLLTPIVDDPWLFGRIAAVNALSDVYAMGGRPITALNIVCFPVAALGVEALRRVVEGGLSAIVEAGAVLVGGHSIKDEEPKYGLAVTGLVDPARMTTNDGLRPGDALVLTKPIGTGVISGANKSGLASAASVDAMVAQMSRLNDRAAALAAAAGVRAATDVTGFGLGGHLLEMARASRCVVRLEAGRVPLLPGAADHAAAGRFPGGSKANRAHFAAWTEVDAALADALVGLVFDAQTSGGLLLGVAPAEVDTLVAGLTASGHEAAVVGEALAAHAEGRLILTN